MSEYRIGCFISARRLGRKSEEYNADLASIFLGNPRSFHGPLAKVDMEGLANVAVYAHAPYAVTIPHSDAWVHNASITLLKEHSKMAADIGAKGIVVHGGTWRGSTHEVALRKWARIADFEFPCKVLVENQASSKNSMTCTIDEWDSLWNVMEGNPTIGACLDTAHAWAAGWDQEDVYALKEIVGTIDLVHSNGAAVEYGCGLDKHSPFESSLLPFDIVLDMVNASGCRDLAAESRDPLNDIARLKAALL